MLPSSLKMAVILDRHTILSIPMSSAALTTFLTPPTLMAKSCSCDSICRGVDAAAWTTASQPDNAVRVASASVSASRKSYEQRREEMRKQILAKREAMMKKESKPRFTGAELDKHLKEYQLELIKRGNAPLLPVPVTPEMEKKLVDEGFLSPQDAGKGGR